MNTLQDFFENAKARNLCDRGAKIWEHCGSKKALMDFCLGSWGMDYVCNAICQGWGISPDAISREFAPFLNGAYVRNKDGYTSAIYCQTNDDIHIDTTAAIIVDCNSDIYIDRPLCELYAVNSNINVFSAQGKAIVRTYNSKVANRDTAPVEIKTTI